MRFARMVFARHGVLLGAVVAAFGSVSSLAWADPAPTKAQCLEAHTKGQDLRRDGRLSAAREQFRTCGGSACPALVRDDCTRRLDELDKAQPTVVFEVKDGAGRDVSGLRVTVDGELPVGHLEGAPLSVDPGDHTFRFEAAGQTPVISSLVIRETEKNRHERIVMGNSSPTLASPAASAPPPLAAPPVTAPSADTKAGGGSATKTLGLVVAGVGVAGLVVGSIFGAEALSAKGAHCGSDELCDPGWASTTESRATISTVGFVAGGVLAAGGVALFLLAPSGTTEAPAPSVAVSPLVGPSTGGFQFAGRW
jgi:hypothetical protein